MSCSDADAGEILSIEMARLENSVANLVRSNEELAEALLVDADPVYAEAIGAPRP
jgi:hypothetical protein